MTVNTQENVILGIDLGTQSIKAILLDSKKNALIDQTEVFFNEISNYSLSQGFNRKLEKGYVFPSGKEGFDGIKSIEKSIEDRKIDVTPVSLWLTGLEQILDKVIELLKKHNYQPSSITSITGSAQQHGLVYWSVDPSLEFTETSTSLVDIFSKQLALTESNIWSDSSTTQECDILAERFGKDLFTEFDNNTIKTELKGHLDIKIRTGSIITERFALSQIFKRLNNPAYNNSMLNVKKISLISSFLSTVLSGNLFPIELSEASGTNLLDINTKKWDDYILSVAGINKEWLGEEPVHYSEFRKPINSYFVKKYGFNESCNICPFLGDNPATLLEILKTDSVNISLGTSDTIFFTSNNKLDLKEEIKSLKTELSVKRLLEGNILIHPLATNEQPKYINMFVFKNGSLCRETIRDYLNDHKAELDEVLEDIYESLSINNDDPWSLFNAAISETGFTPGEITLMYPQKEITPLVEGMYCFRAKRDKVQFVKDRQNTSYEDMRKGVEEILSGPTKQWEKHAMIIKYNSTATGLESKLSRGKSPSDYSIFWDGYYNPLEIEAKFGFNARENLNTNARYIVVSHFLSLFQRFLLSKPKFDLKSIILTGGASKNKGLQQIIADVFCLPIENNKFHNGSHAAALGATRPLAHNSTQNNQPPSSFITHPNGENELILPATMAAVEAWAERLWLRNKGVEMK